MSTAQIVVTIIVLGACLLGGFALLLRVAMERGRLVSRYDHIKAVMAYEEQARAHQQEMQASVANRADFVAEVDDGPEAEDPPVAATAAADAQSEAGTAAEPVAAAQPAG